MISLRKADIPDYLKHGELFQALAENDDNPDEELSFPASVLKPDTSINCPADIEKLVKCTRFWGVEPLTIQDLVDFALRSRRKDVVDMLLMCEVHSTSVCLLRQVAQSQTSARMRRAITLGSVELIRYLARAGVNFPPDACTWAADVGNCDVFIFLYESGCAWSSETSQFAAMNGNVAILKYMTEHGHQMNACDLNCAALGGSLDCFRYLVSNDSKILDATDYMLQRTAIICGHLHIFKFLLELGVELDGFVGFEAARTGRLNCLQFAHQHGCFWNSSICKTAAVNGHLDCLQYAHEHGCPLLRAEVDINHTNPCYEYVKQYAV